ncbi:hypothetical protein H0243_14120 [Staphylococcus sciuri]|uniref:hypothetical protein n=1 Tax=Mammaliicoccus sciuri TaxID=1296 RepID=UPI0018C8EFA9|nr:hypothetical protein [Mammaliicoccus sciuri]MBG9206926.1 hypothetical protein [Mammaliicoccus sciuri]
MKIKFTHATLLILTLALLLNMLIPQGLALADNEKSEDTVDVDKLLKEEKNEGGNAAVAGEGAKNLKDESMWTIYAQFMMKKADKEERKTQEEENKKGKIEKAFNGMVNGIIGEGGIKLDIPYNKMYSLSNQLRGNKKAEEKDTSGTQMASFLSTYSSYNYIDSISGNKVAAQTSNVFTLIAKLFAGFIIIVSLALYYIVDGLLRTLVDALIELNPFKLLGFGEDTTPFKNPINKAIQNMFNSIGLDNAFFEAISSFGLIFIIGVFGFMLMKYLSDKNLQGIWAVLRKFAVQIFTIFAMIPLIMMLYSEVGKSIKKAQEENAITSNVASQYILNVRGWAASQNLSPTGTENTDVPYETAKNGHVDKDFDPTSKREMIADINRITYNTLYGKKLSKQMGFQLVDNWMKNDNFNVNTYMGDIQRGSLPNGGNEDLPAFENYNQVYPNASAKDIEYVIWSATQNVNEKLRDVNNSQFKSDEPIGVRENTFSTQSVALMLQSSFDSGGAHFYSYNLSATGQQSNAKNVSTVPTEWKSFTMPGDGTLGVIASGLGLTSKSLGYAILGGAAIFALLTVNLWEAGGNFLLSIGRAVSLGSFNHSVSAFFLSISILVSALIGFLLPQILINFVTAMVGVVNSKTNSVIPSSITEIVSSIVILVLCYYIGIGAKVGAKKVSPMKMMVGAPNNMAIAFTDRINILGGNNIGEGLRQGFRGAKQQARSDASDLANKGKETVQGTIAKPINAAKTTARKSKDTAKGATLDGAKGAMAGFVTGGFAGAATGAAKGAAKGGFKGATGKEFKNPKKSYEEFVKNAKANNQNVKPKGSARTSEKDRKQEISNKKDNSVENTKNNFNSRDEIRDGNLGSEKEVVHESGANHKESNKNNIVGAKTSAQGKNNPVKADTNNSKTGSAAGGKGNNSKQDSKKKQKTNKNMAKSVGNTPNSKKFPTNTKGSVRKSPQEKDRNTNKRNNTKQQQNNGQKSNQPKSAQNQNGVNKAVCKGNNSQVKRNGSNKMGKPNQNNSGKRNPITEKRKAKERQQNINVQRRKQQAKNNQKIPDRGK